MSSFKDLVKQVNANKSNGVSYNQYQSEKEEDEERNSSFKDLVRGVNNGTIKVGSTYDSSQVNDWFAGVSKTSQNTYNYLKAEGYKNPGTSYLDEIDSYLSRANLIGQYIRSNKNAFDNYEEVYKNYSDTVSYLRSLQSGVKNSNDYYARFENEDHYNVTNMSLEDLKAKLGDVNDAQSDIDLIYQVTQTLVPIDGYGENATYEEQRKYEDYRSKLSALWEKYGKDKYDSVEDFYYGEFYTDAGNRLFQAAMERSSGVAYTTKSGENLTWQSLYDNAVANQDLSQKLDMYSSNDDWDALSKGIDVSSDPDRQNDYDLVFELSRTNVAYDKETALANGTSEAEWNDIDQKRRYISNKYGVDLYSNIYDNVYIFNEIMAMLDEKSWKSGELFTQLAEDTVGDRTFQNMRHLTDDEEKVLNYIFYTQGRDAALQWHNSRMNVYQDRANGVLAKEMFDWGKESWGGLGAFISPQSLSSVALSLGSGVEQVGDWITGDNNNTLARASSAIRSGVSETTNWAIGNFDAFDFVYNTTMSGVDSMAASLLPGNAGGVLLGLSAAAQATNDALDRGMSNEKAFWSGLSAGIFEGLFESWSIGKFKSLQAVASAHGWDIAMNIAKSMLVNASEEALTEIANIAYDSIVNGDFSQYETAVRQYMANGYSEAEAKKAVIHDLHNQGYEAALSGALMGGGFGFIGSGGAMLNNAARGINSAKQTYNIGKATLNADGGMDALQALAMDVTGASDSKASKKANKLDGDLATGEGKFGKAVATVKNMGKNWRAGQAYRAVQSTISEKNKTDLATALKEKGFSEKSAKNIADAIVANLDGKQLSNFQKSTLELFSGNAKVGETITKVFNDADSSVKQRISNLAKFNFGIKFGVGVAPGDSTTIPASKAKVIDKTSYGVSEGGKTVLDGNEVKLNGLRKMEDGSVVVVTADNQTADPSEVQYPSEGHALVYENYANIESTTDNPVIANMDVEDRSALAMAYDPTTSVAAKAQIMGLNHAYWYGFQGMTMDENTLPDNSLIKDISEKQRNTAYELGRKAAEKAAKTQKAGLDAAYEKAVEKLGGEEKAKAIAAKKSGKVILGSGIKESGMTVKERASYEMAKVVAKAIGTDIHIYRGMREYGKYSSKTGDIWLNINANISGQSLMAFTLGHELVHMAKQWSPDKFKAFADYLLEQYGKKGIRVEDLIREQIANAKLNGYTLDENEAYEEVIADACQRMLLDSDSVQKMAAYKEKNPGQWQQIIDAIKKFIENIRNVFAGSDPDSKESALYKDLDDFAKNELEKRFVDMVMDAGEHLSVIRAAFGKGTVVEVNANGEFTLAKGKDSNGATKFLYNASTWETGGRDTLSAALKAEGYSEEDIKAALTIMDGKHDLVKQLEAQFPEQERINNVTVTTDLKDGHSVLSALVSNGDYPVNIDLLMVCKKRKAYQRVINRLCETGMIQQATVDALAIAEINKILGKYGFETACLGCFVESRRLRIQEWANTIVKEWNSEVKKRNPNAKAFGFGKGEATLTPDEVMQLVGELEGHVKNDQGNLNLGQGSAVKRMGVLLDKVPSLRKTLSIEDLITPDGLTALRKYDSNLFSMVKSRYGSNSPKFVQEFNPYNHELAMYGTVPSEYKSLREYLYAIGGARMQSFSDFIVENWFDYCQIVADLAARKLPMHTYTKEIALAKLFGLTGIKINMSLIPDIDKSLGKEYAGLTRNAKGELELIWADKDRYKATGGKSYMQSINFADAIALQNDPRYSGNVGTIAVGVSDKHILMMLDDARIRMIIPYHSSGMNPIFADLMGTSYYNDYTMVQNTTVKQLYNSKGQKVSLKLDKTQTSKLTSGFQFNAVLQELGDARAAAQAYKDWCADASKHTITIKGETYTAELTPKFNDFSNHKNYYKLLEDFNTYDCISEEAAPQGDVKQTYPEDFDETLKAELKAQEKHRQKQEETQAFDKAMDEIESYLSTHTKADTVFYAEQHGIKLGAKDKKLGAEDKKKLADLRKGMKMSMPKVDSVGNHLTEDQAEFFENSLVRDRKGNLLVVYHGGTVEYEFDTTRGGKGNTQYGPGSYFTDSEYYAKEYTYYRGGKVSAYYLNIEKMFDDTNMDVTAQTPEWQKLEQILRSNGIEDKFINRFKDGGFAYMSRYLAIKAGAKTSGSWEGSEKLNAMLREAGFQGIKGDLNDTHQYVIFTPNQAKLTTNEVPSSSHDTRYSMPKITDIESRMQKEAQTDISNRFAQIVDSELANPTFKSESILIGYTTDLLRKLGIPSLPMTFNRDHIYPCAKTDEEAEAEGHFSDDYNFHGLGAEGVKGIYEALQDPIAIISPKDVSRDEDRMRSTHDIVAIIKVHGNKKDLLLPVKITVESRLGNLRAEVNEVASAYLRDVKNLLKEAIAQEYIGQKSVFYITKEAKTLVDDGVQFPTQLQDGLASDGIIHYIPEKVNMAVSTNTQSLQFARWFGDWQNAKRNPTGKVSVVVNADGSPMVVYHGTDAYFTEFKIGDLGYHVGTYEQAEARIKGMENGHILSLYVSIKNPLYAAFDFGDWHGNYVASMLIETEQFEDHPGRKTIEKRLEKIAAMENEKEADNALRNYLKSLGYDGIAYENRFEGEGGDYSFIAFDSRQLKSATVNVGTFDNKNPDIRYKAPNSHGMSPRQLLADAFDELVQTPDERELMAEYRKNISKVEGVQERLRKLRAEISKLIKTNGDKAKIAELNKTAKELAELIDKYDRKLLDLEASKPLKDVLARARSAAYQEAKKRSEESLKEYRQQVSDRFDRGVESRRKTAMRQKIRKVIRDLDKILNRGDKKRNVKEDMKDFVAEALASAEVLFTDNYTNEDIVRNGFGVELSEEETKYLEEARKFMDELANLPSGSYDAWQERQEAEEKLKSKLAYRMSKLKDAFFRERQRLNKAEVAEVLGNLADAYAKLEDSEYAYVNGAYHEAVYEYLKMLQNDVGGAKVKDMTLGQLEELHKAYTMVLTTVQTANKMFAEDLKLSKEEMANRVMMEVYQAGGEHGLWSKGQLTRNQASWNNTKPIYAAERTGSSTFVQLVKGLFKGQYKWATDMEEARAFRQKVAEKYGFKNWDMEKTYKFTSSSGIEFELNLDQIMSLYAYAKREQAHDHLLKGGFVFGKNTEVVVTKNGIKRTYLNKSAKAHNISDEIMGEIISKLSKEQKGFVDEMQDYLSTTMGDKGNDVSMKLYGVNLFMEKFYFPLRSAGQFKEKAKEAELKQQQGQISIANSGFTHATKPKASNPVVLDGFTDVWAGHVNEMSLYHSMVLPMEDFRRVYNYASPHMEGQESASVNSVIENAYGDAATGYFDQLYKELNGGAIVDPRENLSKQMIGKFKKASVLLSNSVWVQQFSAIGRAYALIDPKYFIGPKVDKQKHKVLWAEVKQYAPVAIIKEMGGFDTHTGLSANDYLLAEEYGKGEKVKGFIKDKQYRGEVMGHIPQKADELTWCAIWEAVKRETKEKNSKLDVNSEEFLKKAGERFSEVIEKTQVYDSVLARSANMRSKQGLMQMLTAFMAEPTTTVNMIEDALRKGNKKIIARTFGAVAASVILNNALASIIYAMRDDDEDENFLEKYAQAFASGMLDDINPMTYYPILKDIWSLFQGYDVERTDMAIYSDIADAVKKAVTLISKYDSEMDAEEATEYYKKVGDALVSLLDAGASAFGIPWKNVRRDLVSYYNTYKTFARGGSTTWNSFVDAVGGAALDTTPLVGLVAGKSNTDKLYNAIISGDTAYANRLKSGYKDADAYSNAVRKALRDNDPRVKEAALAQINGNPSERVRIAKLIIADGFSQDDVVRAINAEINAMTPNEQSAKKEKGFYTAEDFAREIANGDHAAANAAKSDVIRTAEKNGKTTEEAEESFASSARAELKELFLAGKVSEDKVVDALVSYCDMDEAEAELKVESYVWEDQGYEGATSAAVRDYNTFCASVDVPKDVYLYIRTFSNNTENDKDANGKTIAYSAMKKIIAEIDAQAGLSSAQKTAIARSLGWADKNIQKYKTW